MTSDHIFIRDLQVHCVIGIQEWERLTKQDVLINLELTIDATQAGQSDRIEDTVNYKSLTRQIIAHAENSSCFLVEALAEQISQICLQHARVEAVRVEVEKPGALRFARSVGIAIHRTRP